LVASGTKDRAGPVIPRQPRQHGANAAIREHAIRGRRKIRAEPEGSHTLSDSNSLAGESEPAGIEGPRPQRAIPHEKQMPRAGVKRWSIRGHEGSVEQPLGTLLLGRGIERADVNPLVPIWGKAQIHKMTFVLKK
jgi:hypothetical protein